MKKPGILSLFLLIFTFTTACFGGIFLFKKVNEQRDETASVKPGYIFTSMKARTPQEKFKEMVKLKESALVNLLKYVRVANKQLYISTSKKKSRKGAKAAFKGVLDINKATAEQFSQIKGIGKGTAQNIVKYRKEHGPFMSVDDLTKVKRIGKSTIKKIGKYLKVDEKIAAQAKAAAKAAGKSTDTGEKGSKKGKKAADEPDTTSVVNINTASAEALSTLKGIGSSSAERIIKYRKDNGPFKSIEDLAKVKRIGASIIEKNRSRLTTGQPEPAKKDTEKKGTEKKDTEKEKPGSDSKSSSSADAKSDKKTGAKSEADSDADLPENATIDDMSSMIMNELGQEVKEDDKSEKSVNSKKDNPADKSSEKSEGKSEGKPSEKQASDKKEGGLININTADVEQLCKLKGIGKSSAQRIIDYRKANGPFKTIEDITKVKRIGTKTLEKFKHLICVE